MRWGCVIAAGGRESGAMAAAMQTDRKALCDFCGRASIARVLDAVAGSRIGPCVTVSGTDVRALVHYGEFVQEADSAISNVVAGLAMIRDQVDGVLFLPSDVPLLSSISVDAFLASIEARAEREWVAIGLCPTADFLSKYPGTPTKSLRLREGKFVSGSLYAATPSAFDGCIELLRELRASRKNQLRMAMRFGLGNALKLVLGLSDQRTTERVIGRVAGAPVLLDLDAAPDSCMDFDDPSELAASRRYADS